MVSLVEFVQLNTPELETEGLQYLNGALAVPVEYAITSPCALTLPLAVTSLVLTAVYACSVCVYILLLAYISSSATILVSTVKLRKLGLEEFDND